jgi:hypothetical protein
MSQAQRTRDIVYDIFLKAIKLMLPRPDYAWSPVYDILVLLPGTEFIIRLVL